MVEKGSEREDALLGDRNGKKQMGKGDRCAYVSEKQHIAKFSIVLEGSAEAGFCCMRSV